MSTKKYREVMFVVSLACIVPTTATAISDPCEILGRGILSEERSFTVEKVRKSNLTYLCESSITTRDDATEQGWKIGFAVEGVPIELLWSSKQKERDEARKAICSTVNTATDRLTVQEAIRYVPLKSVAALYAQCVATQKSSAGQIAAYFIPPIDSSNLVFQIYFAKDLAIPDPIITRAEVQGATTTQLKDGAGKSIVNSKLKLGASTFTLTRTGNAEVRVVLETNQGQKIPVMTIPPVPLDVEMRFDVYGNVIRQERWGTLHLSDERNCGDDVLPYTRDWKLGPFERFASTFAWSKATYSGNCDGKSDVDGVTRLGESHAAIQYHMVGCGYGLFNTCKGRGWIGSTISASVEDLDPTSSRIWTESDVREIEVVAGSEPFYLLNTVHQARVNAIEWNARITYPFLRNGAIVKRQIVLNKNNRFGRDAEANLCFYGREGSPGSVIISVTDRRNYQCDGDPQPDPVSFLMAHDPCIRDDSGLGRAQNLLDSDDAAPEPCKAE